MSIVTITNHDLRMLKRRRDHLYQRMENNGKADTGYSFDAQEARILDKVVNYIERQAIRSYDDGEEATVSN